MFIHKNQETTRLAFRNHLHACECISVLRTDKHGLSFFYFCKLNIRELSPVFNVPSFTQNSYTLKFMYSFLAFVARNCLTELSDIKNTLDFV